MRHFKERTGDYSMQMNERKAAGERRDVEGKVTVLLRNSPVMFPGEERNGVGRKWEESNVKRLLDTMEMGTV